MALATTTTPAAAPAMGPAPNAPGVQTRETLPTEPRLIEGLDPVLLMRLYPGDKDGPAAAMAAGKAVFEAAKTLIAAQQVEEAEAAPPPKPKG